LGLFGNNLERFFLGLQKRPRGVLWDFYRNLEGFLKTLKTCSSVLWDFHRQLKRPHEIFIDILQGFWEIFIEMLRASLELSETSSRGSVKFSKTIKIFETFRDNLEGFFSDFLKESWVILEIFKDKTDRRFKETFILTE
jgi:hypothetical protein